MLIGYFFGLKVLLASPRSWFADFVLDCLEAVVEQHDAHFDHVDAMLCRQISDGFLILVR